MVPTPVFRFLVIAGCLLGLAAARPAAAQDTNPTDEAAAAAERIRQLQGEIEELLRSLSPEARREVERLLAAPEPPPSPWPIGGEGEEAVAANPEPPVAPGGCRPLAPFDTDDDGRVSARDRYWRYLYLVPPGSVDRGAAADLYESGVRAVDADLAGFSLEESGRGRIDVGRFILFDFDEPGRPRTRLAVDATRLARGDGPQLLPAEVDTPLTGLQPLEPGQRLRFADGRIETLGGCF